MDSIYFGGHGGHHRAASGGGVCVDQLAAQPGGRVGLDPGRLPHEVRQVQAAADRGAGGGADTAPRRRPV